MKNQLKYKSTWQLYNESTRSQVLPNIFTYSDLISFQNRLAKKYDNCSFVTGMKHIDNIINDSEKGIVIKYHDYQDFDEEKQYLEKMLQGDQINIKFKQIVECYVFYEDIPRIFIIPLSTLIIKRTQKHRAIKYKALKCSNHECSQQQINQNKKLSKYLPTSILFQKTQDSFQTIINQLSILIQKHSTMVKKNIALQKCSTILKNNQNNLNKLHKLFTLQNTNTKRNTNKSNNQKSSSKKQSICKQKLSSQQIINIDKKKINKQLSCKSKRLQSNRKSVQQLIRLRTISPQIFQQQKLKKKHIRFVTSQHQQRSSSKLKKRHKRISYQKIGQDKVSNITFKPLKKRKIKYQN